MHITIFYRTVSADFTGIHIIFSFGFSWLFMHWFNKKKKKVLNPSFFIMFLCHYSHKPSSGNVGITMHCLNRQILRHIIWQILPKKLWCVCFLWRGRGVRLGFPTVCRVHALVGEADEGFLTLYHSRMRWIFLIGSHTDFFIRMYFHLCTAMYSPCVHMTCFWYILTVLDCSLFTRHLLQQHKYYAHEFYK